MNSNLSSRILDWINDPDYHPVKPKSLARHFHLKGPDRRLLDDALDELLESGRIREDRRGRIVPRAAEGNLVGTIKKVAGGAYLIGESGPVHGQDVFIPAEDLHDAHSGDEVLVRLTRSRGPGGRRIGKIEEILNRATSTFVGTYSERSGHGFVRVDGDQFDRPIPVDDPGAKGAAEGDKVVIEVLRFPTHAKAGEAVLVRVLGPSGAPEVDTLSIIHEFNLPTEFPEEVLAEAARIAGEFDEDELQGRRDLTGETIITIDPIDARDFDDAISLSRSDDGHWHLGVHIADVAHFVKPGSELDNEAQRRGTSVYLPGMVIPMLPEVISNGLASLQQDRLRYTKSAFIEFDAQLRPVHTEFADSAIKVTRRFAYEEVLPIIKGDADATTENVSPAVKQLLADTYHLAMQLRKRRFEGGALELDLAETKLQLDRAGAVTGVSKVVHDESHQIIEEFMLAANEAVATALMDRNIPFIRRAHPEPAEEKLQLFGEFVGTLGFTLKKFQSREELQDIILRVRGQPLEQAVNYALLRSFRQAEYTVAEEGHYALAMENYCHFTSPIRRYPDLTVHRILAALAGARKRPKGLSADHLEAIARRCSDLARRAEAAERELIKIKLLRHMSDQVGDEIDAVITGVERFGVFCRGTEIPVEGLLHITAIGAAVGEVIDHDEAAHALVARTSGWTLQIGRPIRVKIARVDIESRRLEFVPPPDLDVSARKIPKGHRKPDTAKKPKAKKSKSRPSKAAKGKSSTSRQPKSRRRRQ